jgi:hypothetical protein
MKEYNYKMQWLFSLNGDFTQPKKKARKRVNTFIDTVGCQSFTVIYFRDNDLKIVDSYNNMISYSTVEKANEALKQLICRIYETSNIKYIEFIRK